MKTTKYYIAYGSNMSKQQMRFRCPDSKLAGTSEIKGYELLFKGSKTGAYATIEPKEGGTVPVLIWEISRRDEANLDIYEGFPKFYYKKNLEVTVGGKTVTAMVYIMDEKRQLGVPSDGYLRVLDEAYQEYDFDNKILNTALYKSTKGACGGNESGKG